MTKPYVEGRVAYDKTPITEIIARCPLQFKRMPVGRSDVNKYYLTEGKGDLFRLVMISQLEESSSRYLSPNDHNIIITVFGRSQKVVREGLEDVLEKIKIETRPAPPELVKTWDKLAGLYEQFLTQLH